MIIFMVVVTRMRTDSLVTRESAGKAGHEECLGALRERVGRREGKKKSTGCVRECAPFSRDDGWQIAHEKDTRANEKGPPHPKEGRHRKMPSSEESRSLMCPTTIFYPPSRAIDTFSPPRLSSNGKKRLANFAHHRRPISLGIEKKPFPAI